ncbi:MAG: Maf family protein [Myxococcota bacterium]|nr:Maf family protein [Myxococcota bacterium]
MAKTPQLVLASASPRRRELLESAGFRILVQPQGVDETVLSNEKPRSYARRVALEKAQACSPEASQVVLAADTVVAFENEILGKPEDDEHAFRILSTLSGQIHYVHTAVVVLGIEQLVDVVTTQVQFRKLSDADIQRYINTGDGRDKAGSYGIQSKGGWLVDKVTGCYTNVVGLPLPRTIELLGQCGVRHD